MAKRIVAGNWKMNLNKSEAQNLLNDLKSKSSQINEKTTLVVCPPSIYFQMALTTLQDTGVKVGAQNCSSRDNGAFTGELSADMLNDFGLEYVILGHSERRLYDNETDSLINNKVHKVLEKGLKPIVCVGENLQEREGGDFMKIISNQISRALYEVEESDMESIVIAYEPVWAIGTGKTASSAQAQEVHSMIRQMLSELYSPEVSASISILYGGSCKPTNSKELFEEADVDGGLIGGASLDANSFVEIGNSF